MTRRTGARVAAEAGIVLAGIVLTGVVLAGATGQASLAQSRPTAATGFVLAPCAVGPGGEVAECGYLSRSGVTPCPLSLAT